MHLHPGDLDALLLDDNAEERAETLAELQRQSDVNEANAMWAARDAAEWDALQRLHAMVEAAELEDAELGGEG